MQWAYKESRIYEDKANVDDDVEASFLQMYGEATVLLDSPSSHVMNTAVDRDWVYTHFSTYMEAGTDCYISTAGEHDKIGRSLGASRGSSC